MKREFLKEQGLTDEQIKAVMTEYGKSMDKAMEQVNSLTTEKDNLANQIADRDSQLAKLKDGIQDNADLKDQITKLQQANKQAKKDFEAKMASQKKAFLVDKAISGAGARNSKAVSALLDLDKVSLSDNGLEGLDDQLTALKESDSYLFNIKDEPQPTKSPVSVVSGQPKGEGTPTINLATASYQEIKQFKDNHPDEYQALTKD